MMASRLAVCTLLVGLLPFIIEGDSGCELNGVTYKEGERINKNPCSPCTCSNGGMMCAAIDCAPAYCVNAVRKPNQCCETCPDGNNCQHKGVVIKFGDVYKPDPNTLCSCSTLYEYMYARHEAVCVSIR